MFVTTKKLPTLKPIQFRDFLLHYPKIDVDEKFKEYEIFAKNGFAIDGKFSMKWLASTLKKIDDIYYKGQLLSFISLLYGKLLINGFVDEIQTAGFVVENERNGLELCLNQKLFIDLFKDPDQSYHAGGLICTNIFSCVSQVLLHECIHLALTVCEKLGIYDDNRHHGKVFSSIAKKMLGHCDTQHGLVHGLNHEESLCKIRSQLHPSQKVLVFYKNKFVPGIIEHIYRKKVDIFINNIVYTVHIGLIKPFSKNLKKKCE
jgi:hypothetical protein